MPAVSFEYFPPRDERGEDVLHQTVELLSQFQPDFQSVTYGAGGSSRDGTLNTLKHLTNGTEGPTACHLTYTGSTPAEVAEYANLLWENGVRNLVALRGDSRGGDGEEYFTSTSQLIRTLKRHHPFDISVACYPETHPLARSRHDDLAVLKEKQDAGASRAITQFFFDNSVFYEFVEEARSFGITIPIIPGILPIYNFSKVKEMAKQCGAHIPEFVHIAFEKDDTCGGSSNETAAELLKAQVHDLAIAGYESIHVYTLNRASLASVAADAFLKAHIEAHSEKKSLENVSLRTRDDQPGLTSFRVL